MRHLRITKSLAFLAGLSLIAWWRRPLPTTWQDPGPAARQGQLAYRTSGHGGVPVLLLHGMVGSSRFWGVEYDRLSINGQVVAVDLLGFGGSPRPQGRYDMAAHVDAVLATLDEVGITEAVVIGAHSLGALIAIGVAVEAPERVAGIVMFGPPLYSSSEQARERIGGLGGMSRLLALDTPLAARVCAWMCTHRATAARLAVVLRPDLPGAIARDSVQHSWDSYSGTMRNVILAGATANEVTLAARRLAERAPRGATRIGQPLRIVFGDRDLVVDRAALDALAREIPQLRVEAWRGGHDLPLRDPQRCIGAIMDMQRSVAPFTRDGHDTI